MHPLLAAMDVLQDEANPPFPQVLAPAPDARHVRELANQLEQLLIYGDASAADILQENATELSTAFPEQFLALRDAVDTFDFDNALALLRVAITPSN